jgi:hypothetical protein
MRTHIIWRNPSPPPNVKFKLRRVARNQVAAVYRVLSPNYKSPFEVIHTTPGFSEELAGGAAEESAASPAELVRVRW